MRPTHTDTDIAIVGAGAAGLATAIFARRRRADARVRVIDGARAPGAKILVSGGSRCNVTNVSVTEADFNGGRPALIRQVLRAFPASAARSFFEDLGVRLHEEECGKLFPDSNTSRDILAALLGEMTRLGVTLQAGCRVQAITAAGDSFQLETTDGPLSARVVVLATGGLSLPKTGSDGAGYRLAMALGHTIVPTTPALVPLLIDAAAPLQFHDSVSGVAQPVELCVAPGPRGAARVHGSMLWTHFGVSGPAALDASRHWLRAALDGSPTLTANLLPAERFETLEARWLDLAHRQPRTTNARALGTMLPASVADAATRALGLGPDVTLAGLTRDARRRMIHRLLAWPLAIIGSRGYNYAEVTAGGVALPEVDARTMESRVCPGLYLVGEILDVDGRLGGFNFQWAWSSAKVAGDAAASQGDRVS